MILSVSAQGRFAWANGKCVSKRLFSLFLLSLLLIGKNTKAQTFQIGTGTTVTSGSSGPAPVNISARSARVQYLFTAAELNAMGIVGPQKIDSLGFNVIGAPIYSLPGFTIKMAATKIPDLSVACTDSFMQVYQNANYAPVAGSWNMFGFSTVFAWNGVDNIAVDICFNQVLAHNASGTVEYTATPNYLGRYNALDNSSACGSTLGAGTFNRPNTRFHFTPYAMCNGVPSIIAQTASPLNLCTGGTPSFFIKTDTASGYTFQWEKSATGATPWTSITGATNVFYSAPTAAPGYYHAVVTCAGSGQTISGAPIQVVSNPPLYAALPYVQDFENWQNYCDTVDVPGGNWASQPARGNNSWRRNDQGVTAGWASTNGMYNPLFKSGAHSACFSTASTQAAGFPATTAPGNLDLYVNCSGSAAPKQLYFYMFNGMIASQRGDSLNILLSIDGGNTFTRLAGYDTATAWTRKMVSIPSSSAQTIIRFSANRNTIDATNIGLDSVYVADVCNGQPTAGNILPSGTIIGCAGYSQMLTVTGTTLAGNLSYQWIQKSNGTTSWANAVGAGANTTQFTSPALYDTIQYRLVVTCLGSNLRDTTAPVSINVQKPVYSTVPFTEDFESWMMRCAQNDNPSNFWVNNPNTGNTSWRRNDQGSSASWSPLNATAFTAAPHGSYSARFHSYGTTVGLTGSLSLFLDCSSSTGNQQLQFYFLNASGTDSLTVQLSTNGGATFTTLGIYTIANSWTLNTVQFASNSAQTVIRFLGRADNGGSTSDIGLDYVQILPLCNGTPVAGDVTPVMPCANKDFSLALQNNSQISGTTYQWQQSQNGSIWTNVLINATQPIATGNIAAPTYFRCIVTCSLSGMSDTTPVYLANLAPSYLCYCLSGAGNATRGDIGNVTIANSNFSNTVLNNGVAIPVTGNTTANQLYTDFRATVPPVQLYRSSLYNMTVSQVTADTDISASTVAAYIDYNGNGVFEPLEQLFKQGTTAANPLVQHAFTVPANANIGVTGMRVILIDGPVTTMDPCGTYSFGETEDYLVDIHYPTCDGPTNPGVATSSVPNACKGYTFKLTDTSHQKNQSNITWNWQYSSSNGSMWGDVPGSAETDTLTQTMNGPIWYRLQMVCLMTHDTTYSNVVKIDETPYYKCYCYSVATGGAADSSDIGAFSFANFTVNTGGPHQLNPHANNGSVDYTNLTPIELYVDSTYTMNLYHTMSSKQHANARVTMFMDFNNNVVYDVPVERIALQNNITTVAGWYLIDNITIPQNVTLNVPTGMRVILNNDVAPNTASDDACGAYTSGETADFVVIFRSATPTAVASLSNIGELMLYPNPNNGKFTVSFKAVNTIHALQVSIKNIAGQQLLQKTFNDVGNNFSQSFDMTQQASGIYFVELLADGERTIQKVVIR
ncbi:T9SS type A sorting domain-containing protein [Taibaiella soli]|uniref:MAM domain-containing protein n=1 Tax=Taibaiella soli TaxID=1649169 RepID=A0A2W2BI23_9BACT|nr:GEVED domain-containing protein [Taibaiella soli]PZF73156.1 hypothetical protein DN068_09805 [Taibaiella soli]